MAMLIRNNISNVNTVLRSYIMGSKNKEKNLIFDKIAFTQPIDEDKRLALIDRINDPDFYGNYNRKVYGYNGGIYKNNYQFSIYNENTIKLSLYPKKKSNNFLRVEYNPAKLGKEGRKALREFLIKLLKVDVVKTIYFHAWVTRLDLTLDIYDMEPDLYLHKNRVLQSVIIRDEDSGKICSQILGSDESDCRITEYDKDLEQGYDNNGNNYKRIEIRLRNLGCSMANLSNDLLSEFEKLNFFRADFLNDERFSKRFKQSAFNHGLNTALHELDDNNRRRYLSYLGDYRAYPISLDNSDFDEAHKQALKSLIHSEYQKQFL